MGRIVSYECESVWGSLELYTPSKTIDVAAVEKDISKGALIVHKTYQVVYKCA